MNYYDGPCGRDLADISNEIRYEQEEQDYAYEAACMKVGVLPYGGWGRDNDGDFPFDQPETIGK